MNLFIMIFLTRIKENQHKVCLKISNFHLAIKLKMRRRERERKERRTWAIRWCQKCNETLNPPLWLNKSGLTPRTSVSRIRNDVGHPVQPLSPLLPLFPSTPTIKRTIAHTVDCWLTRPFLCFFFRTSETNNRHWVQPPFNCKRRRALLFDTWPVTSGKRLPTVPKSYRSLSFS